MGNSERYSIFATIFLRNPSSVHLFYPNRLGERPNDPNTEVREADVEFEGADGDDDVDNKLPNDVDHRVRSESANRIITEIDDDALLH